MVYGTKPTWRKVSMSHVIFYLWHMKCRETPREEEQNKRSKPQPHYSLPSTTSSRCWAPARIYFQGNIKLSGKERRGKVWGSHLQIVALHHTQLPLVVTLPGGENDLLKRRRVKIDTYVPPIKQISMFTKILYNFQNKKFTIKTWSKLVWLNPDMIFSLQFH